MRHHLLSKNLVFATVLVLGMVSVALANVSITPATGGTNISADKAANATSGNFTLLGNIIISENSYSDFNTSATKIVLNAPSGWTFQQSGVTATAQFGGNLSVGSISYTATTITINISVSGTTKPDKLTIAGVAVQATDGHSIPASGNITPTITGTIAGLNSFSNLGSLSQEGGRATTLNYSPVISSPQTRNSSFTISVSGKDQFGDNATDTLTMSVNSGTISPTSANMANGTATINSATLTGAGSVTIKATGLSGASVSQTINVNYTTSSSDYFRSQTSGSWSTASTWQGSGDNINWFTATAGPTSSASGIEIKGGNTVTVSSTATGVKIVVDALGELDMNNGGTLTTSGTTNINGLVQVNSGGTLKNQGTISANATTLFVNSNGTYQHAQDGGIIPTATWDANSSINVSGITSTAPSGLGQSFGNVNWTSNLSSALSLNGALTTIRGNFTFNGSGSSMRLTSNTSMTLNIGGSVNASGGTFRFTDGSSNPTVNIAGDFNVSGGSPTFDFANGNGKVTVNVDGDVNLSSGSLTPNNGSSTNHLLNVQGNWIYSGSATFFTAGSSTVIFDGSSAQTIGGTKGTSFNNLTISNTSGNVMLGQSTSVTGLLSFTSGKLDASSATLTYGPTFSGNPTAIAGAGANSYIITGNGSGTGKLTVNRVPSGSTFTFPIGAANDYLPASVNPNTTNLNWSANVFTPATTDATYGSGNVFTGTSLGDIVNAVWVITPSTSSTTATLTLNWTSDLEGSAFSGFTSSNIGLSHYNSSIQVWQNSTATGGASNITKTVTSQFTSFSPFGVGSIGTPLPVSLINFDAVLKSNNTVALTWQTAEEENSNHFDVERSADGVNWNVIGAVAAKGNSQVITNYSFMDASPVSGANYYRLNMVDENGSHSYSDVKLISMNSIAEFRVFPNPARDYVNISLGHVGGNATIRMLNFGGQVIFLQKLGSQAGSTMTIPVQNLAAGSYLVQVLGSDGSQRTGKVVIIR